LISRGAKATRTQRSRDLREHHKKICAVLGRRGRTVLEEKKKMGGEDKLQEEGPSRSKKRGGKPKKEKKGRKG